MRRLAPIVLLVVASAACEKSEPADASAGAPLLPSRAPKVGDFPDNPLLAFVPADTPYVFATFKPLGTEYLHQMAQTVGPIWRRVYDEYMQRMQRAGGNGDHLRDLLDQFGDFSAARLEQLGFSTKPRMVFYGLGPYPVARFELGDGERVLAGARQLADKWNEPLPAAIDRAGHHYWFHDLPGSTWTILFAIGSKEVVIAAAPRAILDSNLPLLLGEQRPAKPLTMNQMKAIAERDGFTGQGVGYADLAKIGQLLGGLADDPAACTSALTALTKRVPRLALGYEDLTGKHLGMGMVLELAPEVLADLRRVSNPLPGFDHFLSAKPMLGLAFAGSAERARDLLPRAGQVLTDVGTACDSRVMRRGGDSLAALGFTSLPPEFSGLRGGYLVVDRFELNRMVGGMKLEGYGVLRSDHAADLAQKLASTLLGIDLPADGKPHALPARSPVTGHVSATNDAIAVALGTGTESRVTEALGGKPVPAPLAVLRIDYPRLGDLVATTGVPTHPETVAMFQAFGMATMQVLVDERGLVTWMAVEMR
jgi:hypothetical protein